MPTLRVPVGGNGHRSIQRPIQTRSDGRCPDVRKKISQSVSHKSEPHPLTGPGLACPLAFGYGLPIQTRRVVA